MTRCRCRCPHFPLPPLPHSRPCRPRILLEAARADATRQCIVIRAVIRVTGFRVGHLRGLRTVGLATEPQAGRGQALRPSQSGPGPGGPAGPGGDHKGGTGAAAACRGTGLTTVTRQPPATVGGRAAWGPGGRLNFAARPWAGHHPSRAARTASPRGGPVPGPGRLALPHLSRAATRAARDEVRVERRTPSLRPGCPTVSQTPPSLSPPSPPPAPHLPP